MGNPLPKLLKPFLSVEQNGHQGVDTSQKVRRFSRGAFHYAVTRVTNVTIGQAVASGSATKYRSDNQENTLRLMAPEETEVTIRLLC